MFNFNLIFPFPQQIYSNITKEMYFSSNFSLAYNYTLASILSVDYKLQLYRTTSYTFVNNQINTTVEVYCNEDNNMLRYIALLENITVRTFSKVMSKRLHYPVAVYTDVKYPYVKRLYEVSGEGSKGGSLFLSLSFLLLFLM
jgi:hypothetical protein